MPGHTGIRRFTTKRFIFSTAGLALATWLLRSTHLTGEQWVYSLAIIIAGHHAEDIIRAWRGGSAQ